MRRRHSRSCKKEDRISNLPEALIHHILSFLDMKYVVQTCVLSRKWRHIWTSVPTLNFNSDIFFDYESGQMVRFIDFVDRVLNLRDTSDLQRFQLVWLTSGGSNSHLSTWILAALRRNVQEISVYILYDCYVLSGFDLPHSLFNCKSLTKLELVMGGLSSSLVFFPESMDLPRLKHLCLGSLTAYDLELSNRLLPSCPDLESLIVTGTNIVKEDGDFRIHSVKLKHFELNNCGYECSPNENIAKIMKVDAPNITSFVCKDYMTQNYSLKNLSSLVTADIEMIIEENEEDEDPERYSELSAKKKNLYAKRMMKFLRAIHNVNELRLSPGFLEVVSGTPGLLEIPTPQFDNLRSLKLEMWLTRGCLRAITYILRRSPNIETLSLTSAKSNLPDVGDDWEAGLLSPCMLSHLKFVQIRGVEGCVNELKFLEFLLKNAMVLEEVFLFNRKADSPDKVRQMKQFSKKLCTFPRGSSRVIILFL